MSLKMNFLIITSIVVLTIFVKMVPAPLPDQENSGAIQPPSGEVKPNSVNTILRNNSAELKLPESNSIIMSLYDNVRKSEYPNKHIVSCEELYRFNEMNKKEIINYSEKTGLSNIHCDEQFKLADLNNYIKAYCEKMSRCEEKFELENLTNYIAEYREKNKIEQPDIAATILYIKDNLIRYNTYNPDISIGANVFVDYSSMKNDDDDPELVNKMEEFKNLKENDLKGLFQALTSCYLTDYKENQTFLQSRTLYYPENAKIFMDTFFLNQFRFFYNLSNAEISVIGNKIHVSVEELINIAKNDETNIKNNVTHLDKYHLEKFKSDTYLLFVKANIKELHSFDPMTFPSDTRLSPDDIVMIKNNFEDVEYQRTKVFSVRKYLINEFIRFTSIWQLYRFDINVYLKYKMIDPSNALGFTFNYDEYILDESDGEKLTALETFKKYFKESLDESYNIVLNMDINVLDESKKNNYYKRTLRTLRNIYQAHFEEIETEASSKFVLRMVSIAKKILTSDKTKQIPDERKKEYLSYKDVCPKPYESDNQSETTSEHKSSEGKEEAYNMMLDNIKITIKNDYYTCDSTRCALPDTVNCKDVLNYMIAHYKKIVPDD